MTSLSAPEARANLDCLIDQVNADSEPVTITGPRGNAVLVGEDAWRAIQETLYLQSIPGMSESLRKARDEGLDVASPYLR